MNKALFLLCAMPMASTSAQGLIRFATDRHPQVNAPVMQLVGPHGPGPDFSAQLYLVTDATFTPLNPVTTFRSAGPGNEFVVDRYVNPVDVLVPDLPPGSTVTLIMRVWRTSLGSFLNATGTCDFGQSAPFTITLGGGDLPPALLVGLNGFSLGTTGCYPPPQITEISLQDGQVLVTARYTNRTTQLQGTSDLRLWNDLNATATVLDQGYGSTTRTFTINASASKSYTYYRLMNPIPVRASERIFSGRILSSTTELSNAQ